MGGSYFRQLATVVLHKNALPWKMQHGTCDDSNMNVLVSAEVGNEMTV